MNCLNYDFCDLMMDYDETNRRWLNELTMINEKYKYSELTSKIIGCAMTVHSALGNGFQEVIYQRAMAIEMSEQGIDFSREYEMPVYYKNQQIGTRELIF